MRLTLRNVLKSLALLVAALVVASAAGFSYMKLAPRRVPYGQTALATLQSDSLPEFRDAFNAREGEVRVLALMSPT